MSQLFSIRIVNPGRQTELDLMKVITIFMMIFMHLQEVVFSFSYNDREFVENSWWILFFCNAAYLAGPFRFLFSMGCTIPFSRHNEPKANMFRGIRLLAVWGIVNVLVEIPMALHAMVFQGIPFMETFCRYLLANDVLFFAGAFFLLFGWLQLLKFSYRQIACVFGIFFAIAQFVGDFGRFLPPWSYRLLSGIVWIEHYSSFPLLNWGAVVMLGMIWGGFLQRCLDKTRLYAFMGIFGAAAVTVLLALLFHAGALKTDVLLRTVGDPLSMHRANILSVACEVGCIALFLSVCHLLLFVFPEGVKRGISFVSAKILPVYVAHWVILPWLGFIPWLHNGRAGGGKVVFVTFALYCVSVCLAVGFEYLTATLKKQGKFCPAS